MLQDSFLLKLQRRKLLYKVRYDNFVFLSLGLLVGFIGAYTFMMMNAGRFPPMHPNLHPGHAHDHEQLEILDKGGPSQVLTLHSPDEPNHREEDYVAKEMAKKVRVACWVMTSPDHFKGKAKHVKATWGRRCNILVFMSTESDPDLPAIKLPGLHEGRDNLWGKTKEAFQYMYDNYRDQADWFMKADDDTYVIVENLRYMLVAYNSTDPIYFGCRFKPFVEQGYMSGGAGYVLSRAALDKFVNVALKDEKQEKCKTVDDTGAEDAEIGICLANVGVKAGDSRDSLGRGRFFPFVPEDHLFMGEPDDNFWYWQYIYYPVKSGLACCSDSAISFHYMDTRHMYLMEYLIYHLKPYGINPKYSRLLVESSTKQGEDGKSKS